MFAAMRRAVAVIGVVVALGTAGCSGSSHPRAVAPSTTAAPARAIAFTVAGTDVIWTTKAADFTPAAKAGVVGILDKWLAGAVVLPLRSGAAGDIAALFTSDVAPRLTGPDRVALVDEGLPRATALTPTVENVKLTALFDGDGAVALVTAALNVQLIVTAPDGPYTVGHTGELVLQQDFGVWRITGYDIRSTHQDITGATTTTTAKVAPAPRPTKAAG